MKTVFNNDELAHIWANRQQDSGRNSNNSFYFEGDTIYSYGSHFPIAKHIEGVELLTTETYSNTTARHISLTWQAIKHKTIFKVFNVLASDKKEHRENFKAYQETIRTLLDKSSRARSRKEWLISQAVEITQEANNYSKHFRLGQQLPEITDDYVANIADIVKKERAKEKAKSIRLEKKKQKENAEKIQAWLNGASVSLPLLQTVYMRVKGANIQTSQGVQFPIDDAIPVFKLIQRLKTNGKEYLRQSDNESIKLGYYIVDRIDTTGNVVAGCHSVQYEQIEYCAKQLGLI